MDDDDKRKERERFAKAFHFTMLNIWREKLRKGKTKAYRTGTLLRSVNELSPPQILKEARELVYSYRYLPYGKYVEDGVGRGYFHGNHGDIGAFRRPRRKRPWMNPKYFMSTMNLKEFMAENLAKEAVHIVMDVSMPNGSR